MKQLIPVLLILALSLACLTASAEGTYYEDMGPTFGFEAGATANDVGTYRVIVCDTEGNPLEGVVVQFCDDTTCSFEMTGADGIAVFNDKEQKEWTVHLPVAPDGYAPDEGEYKTLDTFSDVNIFLEKAA